MSFAYAEKKGNDPNFLKQNWWKTLKVEGRWQLEPVINGKICYYEFCEKQIFRDRKEVSGCLNLSRNWRSFSVEMFLTWIVVMVDQLFKFSINHWVVCVSEFYVVKVMLNKAFKIISKLNIILYYRTTPVKDS